MKRILYIFFAIFITLHFQSCNEKIYDGGFKDLINFTIYDYVAADSLSSQLSMFDTILQVGKLNHTLAAYNPNGNDYTLFLPTNDAIRQFIEKSNRFSSFEELLNDKDYCAAFSRYHSVNIGIRTNDFPYGALPELNLSYQYLTIAFEEGIYQINNEAPVIEANIETSNGWIHVISKAITPVTFTSYDWLVENKDYSIFTEAVKLTAYDNVLNRIVRLDTISENPVTLLAEPDSVYKRKNINNIQDLIAIVSPDNSDYTSQYNQLNNFVAYHILTGSYFLDDYELVSTNYSSFGSYPVSINGKGTDLAINSGKEVFDTIVSLSNDTTFVNYITFYYDNCNVLTQSGTIHFINNVLFPKPAGRAQVSFEFFEEPLFNLYREKGGVFIVEDSSLLQTITWTGGNDQLIYVKTDDESLPVWNFDYLYINGDFTISYKMPKIVQGSYEMRLKAYAFSSANALIEVFLDGVKVGGLVDLTTGNANNIFPEIVLGNVTFLNYETHTITIKTLIPGSFYWDVVIFEPI